MITVAAQAALAGVDPVRILKTRDPVLLPVLQAVVARASDLRRQERSHLAVEIANKRAESIRKGSGKKQ